jgi:hypothetical protein
MASTTTGSSAVAMEPLPKWSVRTADVPKASATGPGGALLYKDFVKYRQRLEVHLAGVGVQIDDFGTTGGQFASAGAASGVRESDHKSYVLAFFTTVSQGFSLHPQVFNRLCSVVASAKTPGAGGTSMAFKTWAIVVETFENDESRATELLQVTTEWSTHVMQGETPPDGSGFTAWAVHTSELYESLRALKSNPGGLTGPTEPEERLMARQVASKFLQHQLQSVGIYADQACRKHVGDLHVHGVLQQLGARFQESQGTAAKMVLAAKLEMDLMGQIQELKAAMVLLAQGRGPGPGKERGRKNTDKDQYTPGPTKTWCDACGVVDKGHDCSVPSTITCLECKKPGHKRWACPGFKQAQVAKDKQKVFDGVKKSTSGSYYAGLAADNTQQQQHLLVVDSGASTSVVHKAAQLASKHQRTASVRGVGGTRQAEAAGTIRLQAEDHVFPALEALALSGTPAALLSVDGLIEQGYRVVFDDKASRIETPAGQHLRLEQKAVFSSCA